MDLKQGWGPLAGWSEGGGIHVSVLTENVEKQKMDASASWVMQFSLPWEQSQQLLLMTKKTLDLIGPCCWYSAICSCRADKSTGARQCYRWVLPKTHKDSSTDRRWAPHLLHPLAMHQLHWFPLLTGLDLQHCAFPTVPFWFLLDVWRCWRVRH